MAEMTGEACFIAAIALCFEKLYGWACFGTVALRSYDGTIDRASLRDFSLMARG
jgi:hypothetical protein